MWTVPEVSTRFSLSLFSGEITLILVVGRLVHRSQWEPEMSFPSLAVGTIGCLDPVLVRSLHCTIFPLRLTPF